MADFYFYLIIIIIVLSFILSVTLDYLNAKTWRKKVPDGVKDFYDEAEYKKAREYNQEKNKLSLIQEILGFLIILLIIILGFFGWFDIWLRQFITHPIWLAIAYFGILSLASSILSLPFTIYNTFKLEEKYGFNRTTPKIFITDKIKGTLVGIIIGVPLLYVILWFIIETGQNFWIYAWLVIMAFILLMNVFYTSLILPLFNKLKPLEEGELRNAIEEYAKKVKFPLENVYVIDGSKRSSKANAFFSGFGKRKKIVLYDTLIEKHTTDELVAVLAHEVGHFKKKHIVKGVVLSAIQTGLMLYVFSLFVFSPDLSAALGADQLSIHVNIIGFSILFGPISTIIGIGMNILSRKHEFEADEFAARTSDGNSLMQALKRLSTDHLSNLHPHPAYVFVYYSHPPLLKRLENLGGG
jgi:STE24 endopeptidase